MATNETAETMSTRNISNRVFPREVCTFGGKNNNF